MNRDDRKALLVSLVLLVLVVLSIAYNTFGQQWVQDQWAYIKRRLYFERVVKRSNLPMHPARFWRQVR
jgi:hypothetical protein